MKSSTELQESATFRFERWVCDRPLLPANRVPIRVLVRFALLGAHAFHLREGLAHFHESIIAWLFDWQAAARSSHE